MRSTVPKPKKNASAKGRSRGAGKRCSPRATATTAGKASAAGSSSATSTAAPSTSASAASEKGKGGRRPVIRTQANAERICALLAEGKSLRQIGAMRDMPCAEAIREWLNVDAAFAAQYARAREEQADHYADEIVAIADRADLKPEDKRVRVDARKWVASKLKPKKYGEKVDVEHSGSMTQRIEKIERVIVDPSNPDG